jgi:hypothetical protein
VHERRSASWWVKWVGLAQSFVIDSESGNGIVCGAETAAGRVWLVAVTDVGWLCVKAPAADIAPINNAVARTTLVVRTLSVIYRPHLWSSFGTGAPAEAAGSHWAAHRGPA